MPYQELKELLLFEKALPVTENWSAAPDVLMLIGEYCIENKPKTIVECSSGTSSLILSQCCHINRRGHVYSLENGADYAQQTQRQIEEFSQSSYCDVIHAPMKKYLLDGNDYQWYDLSNFSIGKIDLLVVDGPPGFIQKNSRYPALPLLAKHLSKKCAIFLDDAARDDEQLIVKQWLKLYPEFQFEYIDNERGCAILKR